MLLVKLLISLLKQAEPGCQVGLLVEYKQSLTPITDHRNSQTQVLPQFRVTSQQVPTSTDLTYPTQTSYKENKNKQHFNTCTCTVPGSRKDRIRREMFGGSHDKRSWQLWGHPWCRIGSICKESKCIWEQLHCSWRKREREREYENWRSMYMY